MGLLDTIMGTAVSGYVALKLTNSALEKVFFSQKLPKKSTRLFD